QFGNAIDLTTLPPDEVDRLHAAKPDRRRHVVNQHLNEPRAAAFRLIVDPRALHRVVRPEHDHDAGAIQLGLQDLAPLVANADLVIPEDRPPAALEQRGEDLGPRSIFLRIAQEHVSHGSLPDTWKRSTPRKTTPVASRRG